MIASKYQHDVVALTYLDGSDGTVYTGRGIDLSCNLW